jgi:hypothetical protein
MMPAMTASPPAEPRLEFSLVRGGPLHTLLTALRLGRARPAALALVIVTWCPLMIMALLEWRAGRRSAIASDYSVHVRLLIAIPIMFEAERSMHARGMRCIDCFVSDRWAPGAEDRIQKAIRSAQRLRDALAPEVILLVLATITSQALYREFTSVTLVRDRAVVQDWAPLRHWYAFVSLPVFQFLFYRWAWRWGIWCYLLWRLSRLPIKPIATHPDRRGGLAFLAEPVVGFAYVVFAAAAVQAGVWAEKVVSSGAHVTDFKPQVAVLLAVNLAVTLGPLLLFSKHLWRCRFDAVRQYDELGTDYTRQFHGRWIDRHPREDLLGTGDIQSLADLGNAYQVIREMKPFPFELSNALIIVAATILPMIPVAMLEIPLLELIRKLGAVTLGGVGER